MAMSWLCLLKEKRGLSGLQLLELRVPQEREKSKVRLNRRAGQGGCGLLENTQQRQSGGSSQLVVEFRTEQFQKPQKEQIPQRPGWRGLFVAEVGK